MIENGLVVHLGRRGVEFGLDSRQGLARLVGVLVQDGDQVALADHGHALDLLRGGRIDLLELGPVGGRPEEPGVEHARQADVAGVLGLAGDLLASVPVQERLVYHLERRGVLHRRLLLGPPCDRLALGQVGVRDFLVLVLLVEHDAVLDGQTFLRRLELLGGQLDQDLAGLCSGRPQGRAEEADGHGTECPHIPGTLRRIAHHHVDHVRADVHLIGEHLGQRRDGSLALLDFAGEAGDAAIGPDPKIGIEILGVASAAALGLEDRGIADAEEDDDPAAEGLEEVAARQVGVG